jgi:hypothetical protein
MGGWGAGAVCDDVVGFSVLAAALWLALMGGMVLVLWLSYARAGCGGCLLLGCSSPLPLSVVVPLGIAGVHCWCGWRAARE